MPKPAMMRPNTRPIMPVLINTGRGGLVESNALIGALKSGRLGNLGLDVYEEEGGLFFEDHSNLPLQDDVLARLLMFPNVIVTAHQAFFTREAMNEIAQTTLGNVAAWHGGTPRHVVSARG
jgi:D-lactate dehydrogenase